MKSANNSALYRGLAVMAGSVAGMFVLMFVLMVGGGFSSGNNGGYWSCVLWASFAFGMIFPGRLFCQSLRRDQDSRHPHPFANMNFRTKLWFGIAFIFTQTISNAVYRDYVGYDSAFGKTNLGMHVFPVFLGVGLGSFAMFGLGIAFSATTKPLIDDRLL